MLKFLLIILSVTVTLSYSCRVIEQKANGLPSKREDSSSLVLLEGNIAFQKTYLCGGVLISPRFVLTTAYCVFGMDFVNVHVYAYKLRMEFEEGREIHRATEFIFAPDFDGLNRINDIALIKMPQDFNAKSYITFAQIPTAPLNVGTEGKTYGWGLLDFIDSHAASMKQELPLKIIPQSTCQAVYPNLEWKNGSEGRACIEVISGTNCISDNGAPFMVNGIVYGLQSAGQLDACDKKYPNLIQDIYFHRNWIRQNAGL